jgi:hypothetical protein
MYSVAGVRPVAGGEDQVLKKSPGEHLPIKWMSSPENHIIYKDRLVILRSTTE